MVVWFGLDVTERGWISSYIYLRCGLGEPHPHGLQPLCSHAKRALLPASWRPRGVGIVQ
jgi:hypothetical protein